MGHLSLLGLQLLLVLMKAYSVSFSLVFARENVRTAEKVLRCALSSKAVHS